MSIKLLVNLELIENEEKSTFLVLFAVTLMILEADSSSAFNNAWAILFLFNTKGG